MHVARSRSSLLLAAALLVSCRGSNEPALIGLAYAPTSRNLDVARLAISELQAQPDGPRVALLVDSLNRGLGPDVEVRRAEQLAANPRVMAVVGPTDSRAALAASPVFDAAGITQVNAEATSKMLRKLGGRLLALAPDDSAEGAFITKFLAQGVKARSVSIFFVNDEYGTGLRDGVLQTAGELGLTILDQVPFSPQSDFRVLVEASFMRHRPDAVVVAGRVNSTAAILRAVLAIDPSVTVVAGDGALVPAGLRARAGAALDSLYIVSLWLPHDDDSLDVAFRRRFRALVGREPEPVDAYIYDAIMVSAAAIQAVGKDRDAVWEWLSSLGRSRTPYPGVTGPVSFGTERTEAMHMARIRDGRIEAVWSP